MSAGGGKGQSQTTSPAAKKAVQLADLFAKETQGTRQGLTGAMEEVLKTGGSTIPIISRAIEQTRLASSKATQDTEEQLVQSGLAGTPFGEMIMANTRQQGEIAAGQEGEKLAQLIFQMIPNFVLGQGQTAMGGLTGSIPGMNKTNESAIALGGSK